VADSVSQFRLHVIAEVNVLRLIQMRQVLKQTLGLFHEDSTFYVVRQVNLNQSSNDYAGCVDQVLVINGRIAVLQQEGIDVQNLGLETIQTEKMYAPLSSASDLMAASFAKVARSMTRPPDIMMDSSTSESISTSDR